jgi:O-antigen/teichoic acid export membrane protein
MYLFADLILNKLYYINDSLAINTLRILPIGLLFNGIAQVVSYTLLFYKRDKVMLYSLMLSSIFNVVLNFLIIPKYGIIGCAWLSVFTQFLNCAILFLYYLKNKLNGSFSRT